jgi:fatty acid amide hydrolase
MMKMETLTRMDPPSCTRLGAGELAAAIARGALSATEAVEAHIARIEQVNGALNAVVVRRYAEARAEAQAADARRARGEPLGPLHGVPVTIKECLDLAGTPSTFGLPSRARIQATADDVYVARMRAAGAIVLGKTNVAQLLFYYESDNPVYGRTNNPWNPARTPGGSSGGEAAIIAAGGSPLGLGTDIGGSSRVPAAFCGIAGFKPTAGRTPDAGRYSVPFGQRAIVSQVGVLARQVGDLALGLRLISGADDPAADPAPPLGDPATVDLTRLRVACYTDDGTFPPSPAVVRAVDEAAALLEAAGARVTRWTPPAVDQAVALFLGLLFADGMAGQAALVGRDRRDPRIASLLGIARRSRPTLALLAALLPRVGQPSLAGALPHFGYRDTTHYWALVEAQLAYQARFRAALDDPATGGPFDLVLSPACALPALPHGASDALRNAGGYSVLANVLGYPAGVVPITRVRPAETGARPATGDRVLAAARATDADSASLPVGVQILARPWREHQALAALAALAARAAGRADYPAAPPL